MGSAVFFGRSLPPEADLLGQQFLEVDVMRRQVQKISESTSLTDTIIRF